MEIASDPWHLRLASTATAAADIPADPTWPVLASASLAVIPVVRTDSVDTQMAQLISASASAASSLSSRSQQTFQVGNLTVRGTPLTLDAVDWDMMSATLSARYLGSGGMVLNHDQRVLLSLPNVLLHTVRIDGISVPGSVALRQEVRHPSSSASNSVAFGGVLLPGVASTTIALESTSDASKALTIFVPGTNATSITGLPQVTEPSQSGNGARRVLYDVDISSSSSASTSVVVHIITTYFHAGIDQTVMRRFVSSIASMSPAGIQTFIDRHDDMWAARWATFVDVPSASDRIRLALVTAAYNMHACSYGALDVAGGTYSIGLADDAVVPAQVLMVPSAAKDWLDAREKGLGAEEAADAARLRGFEGRIYPYGPAEHPQVCRWFSSAYADTALLQPPAISTGNVTRVFGTLMSGINAWNYFRVSKDKAWLTETGYGLLEACADLVASIVSTETEHMVGALSIADTTDPDAGTGIIDESLCVAASAALMRAAFEASYLLGYEPPQTWMAARYALALPMTTNVNGIVIARSFGDSPEVPPELPLAVLNEPIGSLVESELSVNVASSILINQASWAAVAEALDAAGEGEGEGPIWGTAVEANRKLIRLQALARAMQVDATLAPSFLTKLEAFLDAHCDFDNGNGNGNGGFGGLVSSSISIGKMPNDLGLSARLLLVFLYGIGGATVCGGVGESGSVYASFGVNVGASAVMPQAWEALQVRGLGPSKIDAILLNRSLQGGGSGGAPYGSSNLVYWSTDSLIL